MPKGKPEKDVGQADYALVTEIRVPHSRGHVLLSTVATGRSRVPVLVSMEVAQTPLKDEVLAEFEQAWMSHLEAVLANLVGLQPLLGLE